MEIKRLGGVNEIGGNKILVEHKGTNIFLDFGMSFNQVGKYFCEFLQPRKCSALADFFELNLLPDMEGIYREDYLNHMGKPAEEKGVDGVFLSHAHMDHAQYIHFLRNDIPIHGSQATKIILKALEVTGSNPFADLVTTCESFTFYRGSRGGLNRVTRRNIDYVREREFYIMEVEKPFKIGSLEVEMLPVDHSLPGACGFIIYSDEGNLVYTGDIRFHGYNIEKSKRFVEKSKKASPKWMLCEGTRIDKENIDNSEDGIRKEISELISQANGLVFVEHPIRDLDRVLTMFESAKANKRQFVVNLKLAYLIQAFGKLSPIKLEDVKIFAPRKSWGLICKEGCDWDLIEKDYSTWERDFVSRENSTTHKELQKNPKKYVVSMGFWEINQLTDIQPKDAIWIKSSCEPFCEEMELDEERKRHWLEHFNIQEFFAHASGHASGNEIRDMIKTINPQELIPIHTEHPELF